MVLWRQEQLFSKARILDGVILSQVCIEPEVVWSLPGLVTMSLTYSLLLFRLYWCYFGCWRCQHRTFDIVSVADFNDRLVRADSLAPVGQQLFTVCHYLVKLREGSFLVCLGSYFAKSSQLSDPLCIWQWFCFRPLICSECVDIELRLYVCLRCWINGGAICQQNPDLSLYAIDY